MVKITDMLGTMDEMRKVYKFNFDESYMSLDADIISTNRNMLVVKTVDENTGVAVTLEKRIVPTSNGK